MTSFIKVPFASSGDKVAVPDTDAGGGVNMTQGYGQAYSLDPATDPSAKRIERDKMNWLFNRITQAINEIQSTGVAPFITSADNGGSAFSYGKGALVSLGGVVYQSLVASNTSTPPSANWAALPEKIQPLDATLTALAGLVGAANKLPYFNSDDAAALTDLTQVGRDIIGKTDIAAVLQYLGLSNVVYGGFDGGNATKPYMWHDSDGRSVFLTPTTLLSTELAKKQQKDTTLTNLSGKDVAGLLTYLGIPDALALKADLSSFYTTRSNTFIAANQPFTGASSGVLRFMCGEFTGTTDKDGNLTVTLPDTYLGKIIYAEAHQFSVSYAGNIDPLIFSSYVLPNTAAASVTFSVRNTKTGMAAGNVQLSCLYFTRGV